MAETLRQESIGQNNQPDLEAVDTRSFIDELNRRYAGVGSFAQEQDAELRRELYGDTTPLVVIHERAEPEPTEHGLQEDTTATHVPAEEKAVPTEDFDTIRSESYARKKRIYRRMGVAVIGALTAIPITIGANIDTNRLPSDDSSGFNFAASLSTKENVFVDGGYNIGLLPTEPIADIDISADSDLLIGVVAKSPEDPSKSGMIYIPTTIEIDGEPTTVPENLLISKTPFGDDEKVNRAPIIRSEGTIGLGLLDNGMVVEAVPGNPDAIRVDRSKLQISTVIPRENIEGATINPPFYSYEAFRMGTDNVPAAFTPESIEKANAVMDADPTTADVIDLNPLLTDAHIIETLDNLPDQSCYTDVMAQLDAGLIAFLQKEFSSDDKKGRTPEVELVGAYTDPATTKRLIFGDQQPKVPGEGDESRFTGDFKFENTSMTCENPRESTIAENIVNSKKAQEDN